MSATIRLKKKEDRKTRQARNNPATFGTRSSPAWALMGPRPGSGFPEDEVNRQQWLRFLVSERKRSRGQQDAVQLGSSGPESETCLPQDPSRQGCRPRGQRQPLSLEFAGLPLAMASVAKVHSERSRFIPSTHVDGPFPGIGTRLAMDTHRRTEQPQEADSSAGEAGGRSASQYTRAKCNWCVRKREHVC